MQQRGGAGRRSLWENSLEELRWSVDVNLWGVIHGIRTFVPILLEQGGEGHIVNTASMAGLTAAPYLDIYNATKHAVVALSETLHKELAMLESGVGVSVVCPGLIQTRIMESARNQPGAGDRDPDARTLSEGGNFITGFLSAGIDDGWPPSRVADAIFDAITAQRFYVIPAQDPVKGRSLPAARRVAGGTQPGAPRHLLGPQLKRAHQRARRPQTGSTRISVTTELARKQCSWAWWCIFATASAEGASRKRTSGRRITSVTASFPSALFANVPTARSS